LIEGGMVGGTADGDRKEEGPGDRGNEALYTSVKPGTHDAMGPGRGMRINNIF
jgi:hypothetical protein